MDTYSFFLEPTMTAHKQYEALRMYYVEGVTAREVADHFGYTYRAMTSLITAYRKKLDHDPSGSFFFVENKAGRKVGSSTNQAKTVIINLRKKYYSVPDIKVVLDAVDLNVSEKNIYNIISAEGFSRLPRRAKLVRQQLEQVQLPAEKSCPLSFSKEIFKSSNAGILMFLPMIKMYHLDTVINKSAYPAITALEKVNKEIGMSLIGDPKLKKTLKISDKKATGYEISLFNPSLVYYYTGKNLNSNQTYKQFLKQVDEKFKLLKREDLKRTEAEKRIFLFFSLCPFRNNAMIKKKRG